MHTYQARVTWQRGDDESFVDKRYSRRHRLFFDGGLEVPGSASPQVVPLPFSDPAALDPEEAFVASLASCHMLWFLALAADAGCCVDDYEDAAEGLMARNEQGRVAITLVTLRPRVRFGGSPAPSGEQILALHHRAHESCFIANSVKSAVRVEPRD